MKAVYRLNEEKLGFNHKVLKEKEQVSLTTIKGLKKRQQKFKEVLRTVKDKFESLTKKYAKDNKAMTKDYKKFTRDFLLL